MINDISHGFILSILVIQQHWCVTLLAQISRYGYADAEAYFCHKFISFISFASIYLSQTNKHTGVIILERHYADEIFAIGFDF